MSPAEVRQQFELDSAGKFTRVEFDLNYGGGNYSGVGTFVLIPWSVIRSSESVEAAFTKHTGHDPAHIIHYTSDEVYDAKGELIKS